MQEVRNIENAGSALPHLRISQLALHTLLGCGAVLLLTAQISTPTWMQGSQRLSTRKSLVR